jgi:hypothetical protein
MDIDNAKPEPAFAPDGMPSPKIVISVEMEGRPFAPSVSSTISVRVISAEFDGISLPRHD